MAENGTTAPSSLFIETRPSNRSARQRTARLLGVLVAASVVVGGSLTVMPAPPAMAEPSRPDVQRFEHPPLGTPPAKPAVRSARDDTSRPWRAPKVEWPAAGTSIVDLTAGVAGSADAAPLKVRAGGLPVWVARAAGSGSHSAAGSRMRVALASRDAAKAAGVTGLLVSAQAVDASGAGRVAVSVDLSSIAGEYGADWVRRARL
ncbi:hypothetical protein, partial [Catellatospora tritici]|uniref:hypothetical protein n=1 Tax=Catellatospora tritici TaxID=2851566 RepID=UPI001C2DCAA0